MSDNVYTLPDLARMRAIEEQIRGSSDEEVADLLTTDDGQWFFVECARHMAVDVARRVVTIVSNGLPPGTIASLLGAQLGKEGA